MKLIPTYKSHNESFSTGSLVPVKSDITELKTVIVPDVNESLRFDMSPKIGLRFSRPIIFEMKFNFSSLRESRVRDFQGPKLK